MPMTAYIVFIQYLVFTGVQPLAEKDLYFDKCWEPKVRIQLDSGIGWDQRPRNTEKKPGSYCSPTHLPFLSLSLEWILCFLAHI